MSSLSIFVFDNADNFVIRRDLTSSELAAKSATFSLPKSLASTPCSFYAVANYDASSAKTKAALMALVEKSAADYNGTFAEVSAAAKRSGGFVMSGSVTKTVGAVNTTTNVGITLKRTVAKVALQTAIDPSFADKYAGTLTINSVKLSKAASQSLVVAGAPTPGPMTFSHTQTPASASGKYNALFYCFENGSLATGSRVLLEIEATYDLDGENTTTDDRSEVVYSIELTGKAAGEILRNGYYMSATRRGGAPSPSSTGRMPSRITRTNIAAAAAMIPRPPASIPSMWNWTAAMVCCWVSMCTSSRITDRTRSRMTAP